MRIKCIKAGPDLTKEKEYYVFRFDSDYVFITSVQVLINGKLTYMDASYFEKTHLPSVETVEKELKEVQEELSRNPNSEKTNLLLEMEDGLNDQIQHLYDL